MKADFLATSPINSHATGDPGFGSQLSESLTLSQLQRLVRTLKHDINRHNDSTPWVNSDYINKLQLCQS